MPPSAWRLLATVQDLGNGDCKVSGSYVVTSALLVQAIPGPAAGSCSLPIVHGRRVPCRTFLSTPLFLFLGEQLRSTSVRSMVHSRTYSYDWAAGWWLAFSPRERPTPSRSPKVYLCGTPIRFCGFLYRRQLYHLSFCDWSGASSAYAAHTCIHVVSHLP